MRASRYLFSERINPAMAGFETFSKLVRLTRRPTEDDNPFLAAQNAVGDSISQSLQTMTHLRDQGYEAFFSALFGGNKQR